MKSIIQETLLSCSKPILLLYPGYLKRCLNEEDFFLWEISLMKNNSLDVCVIIFQTTSIDILFEDLLSNFK